MKNLKKVLALVLAFACAFTMFAGAASFTDDADISDVNRDAVELLTTLKILKGDQNGAFNPNGDVTRAEMAKMIYTIRNGGNDDASAYATVTTTFTDISGHWAEGYIKYLQNTNIVAGKSASKFDPNGKVTTVEAMKMALALSGYRADKAELTGANWANNTISQATTVGMTKDVNSAMAGSCTRENAAQILANTLVDVYAVQWSEITNSFLFDSKSGLSFANNPITVGNKWMDLHVYVGKMVTSGDLAIDSATAAGKDRFAVKADTLDGLKYTGTSPVEFKDGKDHTDLVGVEVKVLAGEKIDDVYGVYATTTSKVVETTMDKIDVQSNNRIKYDGTTYKTENALVYTDGKSSTGDPMTTAVGNNGIFADGDAPKVADSVKMIDWDNDGKYETIITKTVAVGEVTYVGSKSISVGQYGERAPLVATPGSTPRTFDFADNTIAEDLAKDDFAVVTKNLYNSDYIVEKATAVSGKLNGQVINDRRLRVEGNWYTLANKNDTDRTPLVVPTSRKTFTNGDDLTLYVVGEIAYMAKSSIGNDANRQVLMVYQKGQKVGGWNDEYQVKAVLANGDKVTVGVDDDKGEAFANVKIGKLYRYNVMNNGDYALTAIQNGAEMAGYDRVTPNAGVNLTTGKTKSGTAIADEAVIFAMIGTDDAKVYTGKQIKDMKSLTPENGTYDNVNLATADQIALIQTEGGFTYARMLNIALSKSLSSIVNYGWLLEDSVKARDESNVMEYNFFDGKEIRTVKEKTNGDKRILTAGTLICFLEDGEGYIKDVEEIVQGFDDDEWKAAAITAADGNKIAVSYMKDLAPYSDVIEANADTKVVYVDSNANDTASKCVTDATGYNYVAEDKNGERYVNAKFIMGTDGKIEFILIDVEGKLKDAGTIVAQAGLIASEATGSVNPVYNDASKELKFNVTAKGFTPATTTSTTIKIYAADDINHTTNLAASKFDVTPAHLTAKDVAVEQAIKIKSGSSADAGEYVAVVRVNDDTTPTPKPYSVEYPFTVGAATLDGSNGWTPSDAAITDATAVRTGFSANPALTNATFGGASYEVKFSGNSNYDSVAADITVASGDVVRVTFTMNAKDNYKFADAETLKGNMTFSKWENADFKVSADGETVTITADQTIA